MDRPAGLRRVSREARRAVTLALLLAAGVVGTGMLALEVERAEDRALIRAVDVKASDLVLRIGHELQARLLALDRMAARWDIAHGTPRALWEQDAANYVAHYGGFRAIERLDAEGRVAWVIPHTYDAFIGMDVTAEPTRRAALDEAWLRNRAVVSAPVELLSGGTGVLVFLPLYTDDRFDGWLGGVFQVRQLLAATIGEVDGHRIRLSVGDEVFYEDPGPRTSFCSVRAVGVFYLGWRLEVCAAPELEASVRGPLPRVALFVGLVFTGLTAGLLVALQLAGDREERARALAASLREKADALERAQRELAELSWSVSHELRTPLRAIDGYAAMLAEETSECGRPGLARIRANAQRMARQLDGLLELLRVARVDLRVEDVDVTRLARQRLAALAAAEPGRHVEARVDERLVLRGDQGLLVTVIDALLDNAWKFTAARDPGHVWVRATPGGFCVQDDGVGFDMAFAAKLFGPFERLHAPGEFEGLGLGLAIAARAVSRHGGRIRAEGAPGRGATFYVDLPP